MGGHHERQLDLEEAKKRSADKRAAKDADILRLYRLGLNMDEIQAQAKSSDRYIKKVLRAAGMCVASERREKVTG